MDGYLFVDVDGDEYADVIAEALPDVYWFEADNWKGSSWTCRKIGEIPKTDHVNGQGGRHDQIIKGGKEEIILAAEGRSCKWAGRTSCQIISGNKEEIVLAAEGGIYAAEIPDQPNCSLTGNSTG